MSLVTGEHVLSLADELDELSNRIPLPELRSLAKQAISGLRPRATALALYTEEHLIQAASMAGLGYEPAEVAALLLPVDIRPGQLLLHWRRRRESDIASWHQQQAARAALIDWLEEVGVVALRVIATLAAAAIGL